MPFEPIMAGEEWSVNEAAIVDALKLKSNNIKDGGIWQDQAIESRDGSMQLRSCASAAPNGKKNVPVASGGRPVGAAIGDASHMDVAPAA
jgi:hypothetical protein